MITTKMTNSIFLALYLTFLLFLINQTNSVSISDMESSIKSLTQNHLKKISLKNSTNEINNNSTNNNLNKNTNINTIKHNQKINFSPFTKNSKQFSLSECELITDGPICLFNGDRVFLPAAKPKNLIAHWSFDDSKPLDASGNNNHAINNVKAGPAFGGIGQSAFFAEGEFLEVPHNKQFESAADSFSITFWFYLLTKNKQDKSASALGSCALVQKGLDNILAKTFNRSPAIFFDRKEKSFKVYANTNNNNNNNQNGSEGFAFASNARVISEKWLHIALVKKANKLQLYVNGILDTQTDLKGEMIMNSGSLFIGGTPTQKENCKFAFLLDELRFYNYALEEDYVQAEASPALGGIEPNFLQLGCLDCGITQAVNSCADGYKLCSSIEMHTAGYQVARAMGWLKFDTHIWTHAALQHEKEFENMKGLALCCVEIK